MSKKYLIIMIAACVLCLGIGVFIGGGLGENGLFATGVSIGSAQNINFGTEVERIIEMQQDVQKEIEEIAGRMNAKASDIQDILSEINKANTALSDVSRAMSAEKTTYMTSAVCSSCNEIGVKLSWQPGDALNREDWHKVVDSIKGRIDKLQDEASAAYSELQNITQQHENALHKMAELNKRLQDAMARERERSLEAG